MEIKEISYRMPECQNTIMRVIPYMEYEHVVHSGSYYLLTHKK